MRSSYRLLVVAFTLTAGIPLIHAASSRKVKAVPRKPYRPIHEGVIHRHQLIVTPDVMARRSKTATHDGSRATRRSHHGLSQSGAKAIGSPEIRSRGDIWRARFKTALQATGVTLLSGFFVFMLFFGGIS